MGKTRLLVELARRREADYQDGAVFVRLEGLTDPALVAAEIAATLAQRDGTDGPGADGLPAYLRERELLIAVDNFEHLISAAMLIAELLELAPGIRMIISSRTALRIRGEHTFAVEPLELPTDDSEAAVAHSPAVQLFLQRATESNRKLEVDPAVSRTVAEICRALDGLPLAIELAASRSRSLHPGEIADQIATPLSIGEHSLRDLPARQQTLQATIRWSYDLLTPGAQRVLRSAGVFLDGFTLPALEAVADRPVGSEIDELLEASLVRRQTGDGRYELLELVRAFALDSLRLSRGRVGAAAPAPPVFRGARRSGRCGIRRRRRAGRARRSAAGGSRQPPRRTGGRDRDGRSAIGDRAGARATTVVDRRHAPPRSSGVRRSPARPVLHTGRAGGRPAASGGVPRLRSDARRAGTVGSPRSLPRSATRRR